MAKKTIDEATARKLAVQAECDPRTLRRVLGDGVAKTMSAKRALNALVAAGFSIGESQTKAA